MAASRSYFSLSCDQYKQNLFSGFTRLQEQQEFVDLTLAADGHIVKVHKNIMALASPFIKELLKSVSSNNPVIFLNNVNHKILKYLLEYVYQGEVSIPQDSFEQFLQLSQSLHITGMRKSENNSEAELTNQNERQCTTQKQIKKQPTITLDGTLQNESTSNVAARITINNDHNFEVQQFDKQVSNDESDHQSDMNIDDDVPFMTAGALEAMPMVQSVEDNVQNHEKGMQIVGIYCEDSQSNVLEQKEQNVPIIQILSNNSESSEARLDLSLPETLDKESKDALKLLTQFSISERGAVQIILNRYIYYSHHSSRGGRKHRWRCVDYRRNRCPAFVDSLDNSVTLRKGLHNHGFHDEKIYKKHEKGKIYHSYKQAVDVWTLPQLRS